MTGDEYKEDLSTINLNDRLNDKLYDIVKVYTSPSGFISYNTLNLSERKLIWERPPSVPMTLADIEKELSHPVALIPS